MPVQTILIYAATGNAHKVEELQSLLKPAVPGVEIRPATEIGGMPEVDENADTFEGNAALKAEALRAQAPREAWVLADDSGLEVTALEGAPGVHTARYAGPGATDADNRAKLLRELQGVSERQARFVCCLCLISGSGEPRSFTGTCEGVILEHEEGGGGFGYDPVFQPEGETRSFAAMTSAEKNRYSHRAIAANALALFLQEGTNK